MIILGVESSAAAAGAAIVKDGKVLSETYLNTGLTHSQTLLRLVSSCLENAGLEKNEIDAYAVAKGPGSFTGIRIGVSLVKGLCFSSRTPVYGVSTLEAMAAAAAVPGYLICPVMDARCSQVYTAGFAADENGGLARLYEDDALTLEALGERLRSSGKTALLLGDGADLTASFLSGQGSPFVKYPEIYKYQHASAVAFAAFLRYNNGERGTDAESLVPSYLRPSQAERERKKKERQL